MALTTEECLALAVLRGDAVAARMLADAVCERESSGDARVLPAVRVVGAFARAVAFMRPHAGADEVDLVGVALHRWLTEGGSLVLPGCVDRVEVFEFLTDGGV